MKTVRSIKLQCSCGMQANAIVAVGIVVMKSLILCIVSVVQACAKWSLPHCVDGVKIGDEGGSLL